MADTEKLFTQAELDEILRDRIARANKKYEALLAEHEKLQADFGQAQKDLKDAQAAAAELPALKRNMLVSEVATAKNVPAQFVGRLMGNTRDELLADADKLLEDLGQTDKAKNAKVPPTPKGGGTPQPGSALEQKISGALAARKQGTQL